MVEKFVEIGNAIGGMEGQKTIETIDVLQQSLHEEIFRLAQGRAIMRFLVDGGFEGEVMIEVRDVQVRGDGQRFVLLIDGYNGEFCFEFQKTVEE